MVILTVPSFSVSDVIKGIERFVKPMLEQMTTDKDYEQFTKFAEKNQARLSKATYVLARGLEIARVSAHWKGENLKGFVKVLREVLN